MNYLETELRKKMYLHQTCYISKSSNSGKGNRSRAAIPVSCASSGKETHKVIRNMKINLIGNKSSGKITS